MIPVGARRWTETSGVCCCCRPPLVTGPGTTAYQNPSRPIALAHHSRSSEASAGFSQRSPGPSPPASTFAQLKMCAVSCGVSVLQTVQCGVGCCAGLILCRYWLRNGDLFVWSWASVLRVFLFSVCSDLSIVGGISLIMKFGSR